MRPDELLTENEVSQILKVKPQTLRNRRCRGDGPLYIKLDRLVRYRAVDIQNFIEQRVVESIR